MNPQIRIFKRNKFSSPLGERLGMRSFQFLKAAAVSTEKVIETVKLTKRQIEVTMFACGIDKLEGLKVGKLVKQGKDV